MTTVTHFGAEAAPKSGDADPLPESREIQLHSLAEAKALTQNFHNLFYLERQFEYYRIIREITAHDGTIHDEEITYELTEALTRMHEKTAKHSKRVGFLSTYLAFELCLPLPLEEAYNHDLGKGDGVDEAPSNRRSTFYWRVVRAENETLSGEDYRDAREHVFPRHCIEGARIHELVGDRREAGRKEDFETVALLHHYLKDGYPTRDQARALTFMNQEDLDFVYGVLDEFRKRQDMSLEQLKQEFINNPMYDKHQQLLIDRCVKVMIVSAADITDGIISGRNYNWHIQDPRGHAIAILRQNFPTCIAEPLVKFIQGLESFEDYDRESEKLYLSWSRDIIRSFVPQMPQATVS